MSKRAQRARQGGCMRDSAVSRGLARGTPGPRRRRPRGGATTFAADGGLPGSGDVAGAAARAGRDAVAGHGQIVAEFFDVGYSRTLAWARSPPL